MHFCSNLQYYCYKTALKSSWISSLHGRWGVTTSGKSEDTVPLKRNVALARTSRFARD